MPTVNITMVTCNRLSLTRTCLESLLPTLGSAVSLCIVDNGSQDGSQDYLRGIAAAHPQVRLVILARNMGVAVAANLGWALRDADYYLKLDNDMQIMQPGWLHTLLELAESAPEVGLVAHRVCDWHSIEPARLSSGEVFFLSPCANGACVLIPRRVHERFGFWTEDYGRYGFEDLDYSNRVRAGGLLVGYAPETDAIRHLGYEQDVDEKHESIKRTARTSIVAGQKVYLLNTFLFEQGIRDSYVPRKYLPDMSANPVTFTMNKAYRPIMQLHRELIDKVAYRVDGDVVELDLSRLKSS